MHKNVSTILTPSFCLSKFIFTLFVSHYMVFSSLSLFLSLHIPDSVCVCIRIGRLDVCARLTLLVTLIKRYFVLVLRFLIRFLSFVVTLREVSIGPTILSLDFIVLEVVCPWVVCNQPTIFVFMLLKLFMFSLIITDLPNRSFG